MSDLLSVTDAAAFLGVSRAQVYRYIGSGQLRAYDLGTAKRTQVRIRRHDLERFLETRAFGRAS